MDQRGFISSIFDLSFTHSITPKIQRFLNAMLLVASGIAGVAVLIAALGMAGGFFGKLGALIIGVPLAGLVFLLMAMYFRVMMEILIVVFRAVDYLRDISVSVEARPIGGASASQRVG